MNAPVTTDSERQPHPMVSFKRDLEAMVARELDMLDDRAKQRMRSAAIVAVTKDPELLLADRQSFMTAIRMCAGHGVLPDGNEAVLQTYNTKVKLPNGKEDWIKKVTYLPMIRGIVNRVQRSGKIRLFYAEVVHQGETFRIDATQGDRRPVHDFDPMNRTGEVVGAYSVATYHDGTVDTEPMPRAEIDKVKAVAKTKNVWDGWFAEKAKVAVMKRHSKRLPLSAEDMDFILNRDETDFDQAPRDVTPKTSGLNLAQRLAQPVQEPEHAITGEVMPDDARAAEAHWTETDPGTGFPGSDAWTEGAKAFQAGSEARTCPYDQGTEDAADWLGGWHGAKGAAE